MATENKVLMEQARESLKGHWKLAIETNFLYFLMLLVLGFIPLVGSIARIVVIGPLCVGLASYWLAFSRKEYLPFNKIFNEFDRLWRALKAYLLIAIYTMLWSLLLFVPGIIAAFSYSQTYYILAEDKTIGANTAIEKSKEMMYGYKWKLFYLELRFIGWGLLCLLTLGIGFIWLAPYVQVTMAKFYDDVKNNPIENPKSKPFISQEGFVTQ